MKKILSLLLALCMLLPMVALGESAAQTDKATVVELSFEPGKLPKELSVLQEVFTDLLNTLKVKFTAQSKQDSVYSLISLLVGDQNALNVGMTIENNTLYINSEILGDEPIAISKDDLLKIADTLDDEEKTQVNALIEMLFGGKPAIDVPRIDPKDAETLIASFSDLVMQTSSLIADKVVVTEGDFSRDGADKAVLQVTLALEHEDAMKVIDLLGETIAKNEMFVTAIENAAKEDGKSMTFAELWAEVVKDIPEDLRYDYEMYFDANNNFVFGDLAMTMGGDKVIIAIDCLTQEANKAYTVKLTAEDKVQLVCYVIVNNDGSGTAVQLLVADEAAITLYIGTPSEGVLNLELELANIDSERGLVPVFNGGLNFAVTDNAFKMGVLYNKEAIVTMNLVKSEIDAIALPDTAAAVHVTSLTEEETTAFGSKVQENAKKVLETIITLLPANLQSLFGQ